MIKISTKVLKLLKKEIIMNTTITLDQAKRLSNIIEKALNTDENRSYSVNNKELTASHYNINVATDYNGDTISITLTTIGEKNPTYSAYLNVEGQEQAYRNGRMETNDNTHILALILAELIN